MCIGQEVVGEGLPAKWKKKDNLPEVHQSFHNLMVKDLMQDFAASVLQVSDSPYDDNDELISNMPTVAYEMPNGYNQHFGVERFRIPECLFNPALIKVRKPQLLLILYHLISTLGYLILFLPTYSLAIHHLWH